MSQAAAFGLLFAALGVIVTSTTVALPAHAAPAPHLRWKTLTSSWCKVHFYDDVEEQARRIVSYCDTAVHLNAAILNAWPSQKIEIVVSDTTDFENGFAITVPYNRINVFTVGPSSNSQLGHTRDSLELLMVHEVFHIVHLEISSGFPTLVNRFFGKLWPPNQIVPTWIVEGMAVYAETKLTSSGRVQSSLLDARLRVGALGGDLWELDDLSNVSRRRPGGSGAYLYGGRFLSYLSAHHGEDIFERFTHDYGGRLIPYAIQRSWRVSTGIDLDHEYEGFLASLREDAARVRARVVHRGGPSPARRLTRLGRSTHRARFTTSGDLVFAGLALRGRAALFSLGDIRDDSPPTPVVIARIHDTADFVPLDDGSFLIGQPDRYRNNYTYYDLAIVHPDRPLRWVTRGKRLQEPDLFPDGKRAVAARRTGHDSAIVIVNLESGETRDLVRYEDVNWAYTPQVSPDGKKVVFALLLRGGAREIMLLDVATGDVERLTDDNVEDRDPTFTPDGASIVFSSDREDVPNIYALHLASHVVTRVTDTLGAAFGPTVTPDGRAVIYQDLTLDGRELFVAAMPEVLTRTTSLDDSPRVSTSVGALAPSAGPAIMPPPPAEVSAEKAVYYNPLFTLMPKTWAPVVTQDAAGGIAAGIALSGSDAVELFNWNFEGTWGFGQMRPHLAASWRFRNFFFPITLSGDWRTTLSDAERRNAGEPELHQETQLRGSVEVSLPIARWWSSHSFGFGYARVFSIVETPVTALPDDLQPNYPAPTNIGALTWRWSYTSTNRFRDSISTEHGESFTLRLRIANEWTLSPLDLYEATLDARVFRAVPGLAGHVVALMPSLGFAQGNRRRRANYRLGGFAPRDLTADVANNVRFNSGFLRGYAQNADVGDAYWLVTTEYRLPIMEIEKGLGLLPLSLTRISAVAFADVGDAFDGLPRPGALKLGVGAELRVQMRFGYFGVVLARIGYARGMSVGGRHQPYILLGSPN